MSRSSNPTTDLETTIRAVNPATNTASSPAHPQNASISRSRYCGPPVAGRVTRSSTTTATTPRTTVSSADGSSGATGIEVTNLKTVRSAPAALATGPRSEGNRGPMAVSETLRLRTIQTALGTTAGTEYQRPARSAAGIDRFRNHELTHQPEREDGDDVERLVADVEGHRGQQAGQHQPAGQGGLRGPHDREDHAEREHREHDLGLDERGQIRSAAATRPGSRRAHRAPSSSDRTRRATATPSTTHPATTTALIPIATMSPRNPVTAMPAASSAGHRGGQVTSGSSRKKPIPLPAFIDVATAM